MAKMLKQKYHKKRRHLKVDRKWEKTKTEHGWLNLKKPRTAKKPTKTTADKNKFVCEKLVLIHPFLK